MWLKTSMFFMRALLVVIAILTMCVSGAPADWAAREVGFVREANGTVTNTSNPHTADYPKDNPVKFRVRMGVQPVNIGGLQGKELYQYVYDCIESWCPYDHGFCDAGPKKWCEVKVDGRRFHLVLVAAYWPSNYKRLREWMLDMWATIAVKIVNNGKNCIWNREKRQQECSLPDFISISIDHWYGKDHELKDREATPDLKVQVWDFDNQASKFDCVGSQSPLFEYFNTKQKYGSTPLERIAQTIQEPNQAIQQDIFCVPDGGGEASASDLGRPEPNQLSKRSGNKHTLYLSVGVWKQSAGTFKGQELWNKIHDCLTNLCPTGRNGHNVCDSSRKCEIKGVARPDKKKLAYDQSLFINVGVSFLPVGQLGMREIMLDQAAAVFSSFTDNSKNCYDQQYVDASFQMCNVPQMLFLHVGNLAWIFVELANNKANKNVNKEFNCGNTKDSTLGPWFYKNSHQKWADSLGLKDKNEVGLYMECQEDEQFAGDRKKWDFHANLV
ncbi:unnamed protein product [Periconia digitata]|uniref:Uncharacterized protein n=1 Tax=Periconia digitata TaxID=1303443 RepID=A0A9W4UBE5_9PLEO|nr:unnamed protein product [Periconia digitata]